MSCLLPSCPPPSLLVARKGTEDQLKEAFLGCPNTVLQWEGSVCAQRTLENKEFHKLDYLRAALQRKTEWIL